jgi:hypothetical protein
MLSSLVYPELDGSEIACAPIDQRGFCASQRMRPKQPRVQPDPLRYEARILAGHYADIRAATTSEQELAEPPAGRLQIIIDGLVDLFTQFKSQGPPVFFCRTVARSAMYPLAATSSTRVVTTSPPTKLAVDCQIELGEVASAASIRSFVLIDQTCLGRSDGFAPVNFPLFHGTRLDAVVSFT